MRALLFAAPGGEIVENRVGMRKAKDFEGVGGLEDKAELNGRDRGGDDDVGAKNG